MRAALLAAAVALQGCSVFMQPLPDSTYTWFKEREPLPYTTHIVPQAAVQAYCQHSPTFAGACTYWDHEQCWIFASSQRFMDMLYEHEKRHCEGWNHQVL